MPEDGLRLIMEGCLKVFLKTVLVLLAAVIVLSLIYVGFDIKSNDYVVTQVDKSMKTERQTASKSHKIDVPKYKVVARNPNVHKIFIVT